MKLTEDYVLAKTRAAELSAVRNLNLWGNGISDISVRLSGGGHARTLRPGRRKCSPGEGSRASGRVNALELPLSAPRAVQVVAQMRNLEVLSLSVNKCVPPARAVARQPRHTNHALSARPPPSRTQGDHAARPSRLRGAP